MIDHRPRLPTRFPTALAFLVLLGLSGLARAADGFATPWSKSVASQARVIVAGSGPRDWQAGIEVVLAPRTVTYWRTPGDAGTPPSLSYEDSTNVASAELQFPAPTRLDEDGIEAFGYQGSVIFPVRLTAADPDRPVLLRVRFEYAVCQRICVPVHAQWSLALPRGRTAGPFVADLAAARARLPAVSTLGGGSEPRIDRVSGLSGDLGAGKGRFTVEAHVPRGEGPVTLFAEAPPGWYLQSAPGKPLPDGAVRFEVSVLQMPPGAVPSRTPVALTLTAGSKAIEVRVSLDTKGGAT